MKIGVLGAGQLGRMLALAGLPLGHEFIFLDPALEACAASLGKHLRADYSDGEALKSFCAQIDVATYEFENVPVSAAEFVAARVPLYPGTVALAAGQDRVGEKQLFESLEIPVPPYAAINSREDLSAAMAEIGTPGVLKTRRMGYDGKGQAVIKQPRDADVAWAKLGGKPLIYEKFIEFEREVSCIGVRTHHGLRAFYPLIENVHRDGILSSSQPRASDPLQNQAEQYVGKLMDHLAYVGVLAFEFFVGSDGLIANEIAPRVHNSGHWSIEGAECSQFENHIRAITGLPLGSTSLRGASLMLNCLGTPPKLQPLLRHAGVHLHLYGKEPKPQRKIGHVTLTAANSAAVAALRKQVEAYIPQ